MKTEKEVKERLKEVEELKKEEFNTLRRDNKLINLNIEIKTLKWVLGV